MEMIDASPEPSGAGDVKTSENKIDQEGKS